MTAPKPAPEDRDDLAVGVAHLRAENVALRSRIEGLAGSVWRETPCGCGHRADLHTNPVYSDETAICRAHVLCGCDWSFSRIVQHRLRAVLGAAADEATGGEGA